jgi:catechol 2,3-dioxygenase-like lactoylglutathione lyase family enzyme
VENFPVRAALPPSLLPVSSRRAFAIAVGLLCITALAAAPLRPSSAVIRTLDLAETADWYREKLGFRPVSDTTRVQARSVVMERSGFLLEISEDEKTIGAAEGGAAGSGSVTPQVSYLVPDVDTEVDRLRKERVEIVAEPQDELEGRFRIALIRDNGGRLVELREPLGSGAEFHAEGR